MLIKKEMEYERTHINYEVGACIISRDEDNCYII